MPGVPGSSIRATVIGTYIKVVILAISQLREVTEYKDPSNIISKQGVMSPSIKSFYLSQVTKRANINTKKDSCKVVSNLLGYF